MKIERSLCGYMWVGPVPGLEVLGKSFQVDRREVGADAFPHPPLPLGCSGTARRSKLVPEMLPSHPPGGGEGG